MPDARCQFTSEELKAVVRLFGVGKLRQATALRRGSRRNPKLLVDTSTGRFVLKRRSASIRSRHRINRAHHVQQALAERNFPVPRLIVPQDGDEGCVAYNDRLYELFEYVDAEGYDGSLEATLEVGRTLGQLHAILAELPERPPAPVGNYHNRDPVRNALTSIPGSIDSHESVVGREAELLSLVQRLYDLYDAAAGRAAQAGFELLPGQLIHADWHPGNLLFREAKVVAVVDFDSLRLGPRALDVANGLLQFSILGGTDETATWPDHFDTTRMRRFVLGYGEENPITEPETSILVPLMTEALIAEAVGPIAATGWFGRLPGFGFLKMIERKVRWLEGNTDSLAEAFAS